MSAPSSSEVPNAARIIAALTAEEIQHTAVMLEKRGVPALDATLPGEAPKSASRLYAVQRLPQLDLREGGELEPRELIGEGGMGSVSSALQTSLVREVAVKRLRDVLAANTGAAWLLVEEARITGALEHPNIVPVHALGVDDDNLPIMVMKRLTGRVWRDVMHDRADAKGRTIGGRDLFGSNLETLLHVCNAIEFAHSRGIVHRDIKPENVMVGDHGEVYVVDWGAALSFRDVEKSEAIVGTLAYMAPEMLRGTGPEITPLTDVYLLGATLHEILTGRAPHAAQDVQGALFSICKSEIENFPAWVPTELGDVCRRALSREPKDRPQSVLAFKEAIEAFVVHRGSIEITHAATRRLLELAEVCAPGRAAQIVAADDAAHVNQLFIECAFGYRQALQTWSNNPEARAGLQEAYEHMIVFELVNKNAKAAASLLSQLSEPREDFRRAIDELKVELEAEGQELERLRTVAREQDASVASGARATSALVTGVSLAGLFIWLSRQFAGAEGLDHGTVALVTIIIMAGLGAGTYASRTKVLANDVNRRLTATMFSIVLTIIAVHVSGMLTGAPVVHGFIADFFVAGAVTATVGASVHRGMAGVGLVYLVGALGMSFAPALALEIMAATFLFAHLALAWTWRALAGETRSDVAG